MASYRDLEQTDWMGSLPEELTRVPLNTLAIPGSHDSGMFFLDEDGPINLECSPAITFLAGELVPKDIIKRWSQTQTYDVTAQLKAGIRYFDLRVGVKPGTQDWYLLHGLYGMKVEECLKKLKEYLDHHPKEVVLLDMNHFYDMDEVSHKQFISRVLYILGNTMCNYTNVSEVTLDMMWNNGLQVILFYHDSIAENHPELWKASAIPSPWPETTSPSEMVDFLESKMSAGRPTDSFYVSQGVCTPSKAYIAENRFRFGVLFGYTDWSLKGTLASEAAGPLVTWLRKQHSGPEGVNVCIMDFVEMAGYVQTVLSLNDNRKYMY